MSCGESVPISISPDDIDTGNAEDECDTGDDDEETRAADVGVGSQHGLKTEDEAEEEPCHPVEEAGDDDDHDDEEGEAEEEHRTPQGLRDPGEPTPAERAEHCLSHIPYRPWCKHCVRGKAKGRQSRRLKESDSASRHPRVRIDYCTLTDRSEEESAEGEEGEADEEKKKEAREVRPDDEATASPSITILVLQESGNRSVWAYDVQSKGASEAWVVDQIVEEDRKSVV